MEKQTDKLAEEHKEHAAANVPSAFEKVEEDPPIHWRTWLVVLACCWIYFGQIIILSGTGFWHGVAAEDVGGTRSGLWISQGFGVVNAVLGPPVTRISDSIGRKWVILGTAVFGVAGGIMLSAGNNIATLIVGSCFYGIFWSTIGAISSVASEVLPRRWRGVAQVLIQFIGTWANPVVILGGAAAVTNKPGGYAGWRIMNWLGTSCMFVFSLMLFFVYHPPPVPNPEGRSVLDRLLDFDKLGSTLLTFSLVPLLMGLIWADVTYPWDSAAVISTLAIGAFFLVLFALHQAFYTKTGLFHHALFKQRNFWICQVALFVEGLVYFPFNNFYGQEAAVLFDSRPIMYGLRYNAFVLGQLVGCPIFAYVSWKWRSLKPLLLLGFACFLGAAIGLACIDEHKSNASLGCAALAGFGFASPIALIQAVVQLSVEPSFIGVATALAITCRSVGGSVGTAACSAVFSSKLARSLVPYITRAAIKNGLPQSSLPDFVAAIAGGDAAGAAAVPGATPAILAAAAGAAKHAYAYSYRFVWILQIPFVLVALICCSTLTSLKTTMNAMVDRPVQEEIDYKEHHHEAVGRAEHPHTA